MYLKDKKIKRTIIKKQVKGITLVSLVVTIIVLLILAGVAINLSLGEDGIFKRTQESAKNYQNASLNEKIEIDKVSNYIDEYYNSKDNLKTELEAITGMETENTKTQDKYGNPIIIPAGFRVLNPNDDVTKGIVIEDVSADGATENTIGSQFVWIPVGKIYTSTEHSEENKITITLGRYTFDESGKNTLVQSAENWTQEITIDTYFTELAIRRYENENAKNLEKFIANSIINGGYYIGRYEIGDATAIESAREGISGVSNPNNPITCKSGVYPYTYIDQTDAANLCRNMYNSSKFESDLINSYAWDTAIVFIQTFSGDKNYSNKNGNNITNILNKCGENILQEIDEGNENHDVRCNIYDMAGNTYEWTTETSNDINSHSTSRGNGYDTSSYKTSSRNYGVTSTSEGNTSGRPILYL